MATFSSNIVKKFTEFPAISAAAAGVVLTEETHLYDWATVQLAGTFVGTVVAEGSNDGVNWLALPVLNATGPSTILQASFGVSALYVFATPTEYTRIRVSAYTSGQLNFSGGFGQGIPPIGTASPVIGAGVSTIGNVALHASAVVGIACLMAAVRALATTNLTSVKTTTSKIYGYSFTNTNASTDVWIKLYQKASAPVPASDVPALLLLVKAGQTISYNNPIGKQWPNGIAYAITGLPANTDTTAVTADSVVGFIDYI